MTRFAALLLCLLFAPALAVHGQEPPNPENTATTARPPGKPAWDKTSEAGKHETVSDKSESALPRIAETPQQYAACRLALSLLGTVYEEIEPVTDPDNGGCGIAKPIRVSEIIPGLTLSGAPEMRCDTARALGFWARDFLRPAAATLPAAPRLTGLQIGTGYACRERRGSDGEKTKMSEHAIGNAIDIMGFEFDDSTVLPVEPRKDSGNQAEAFQRSARAAACLYFTTVLGPGTDSAHDNHLHLDVKSRNNGWRLCQ